MSKPGRFHGIGPARYVGWWAMRWLLQPIASLYWRIEATGLENIPKDGPFLLLPNHTSLLDPIWVAVRIPRPSHFMAAELLFRHPIGGSIIRFFGAFPKKKQVRDRDSMAEVQRLHDEGQIITIFVEGERTWDGRLNPVGHGVGRMVKRMGAKVVVARVTTGHLQQPRWTTRMRWMPVHIHYEGPLEFDEHASPEQITAEIVSRMEIDPHPEIRGRAWGRRLAEGLPFLLWACPACGTQDALVVDEADADVLRCTACSAAWRNDLRNQLHGLDGTTDLLLVDACDAVDASVGRPAVSDRARFEAEGIVLEGGEGEVLLVPRGRKELEEVARGRFRLRPESFEVVSQDGEVRWQLPIEDMRAVTTEVAGILQIRTPEALYRLRPAEGESTLKWFRFLQDWRKERGVQSVSSTAQ